VLIVAIIIIWPAALQESIIETLGQVRIIPQIAPEHKELRNKTIAALEPSYTNLREIIKIGYETHPKEFVIASNYFNDALSYFPSFAKDHPYTIPYLKLVSNAKGEMTIAEAEEQPQKRTEDDIEKTYPFAENSRKVSQSLLEGASAAKLEQVLHNLEFIRTVDKHLSEKYSEAHNAFIEARERSPAIDFPELSSKMRYNDRFVRFDTETHTLVPAEPIKFEEQNNYYAATEYIRKGYDISQEILAEYYLEEVVNKTQKIREELGEVLQNDPDNAIQELTQKLDEELSYAETIKDDSQHITVDRIAKTKKTQRDAEFNLNIQQNLNRTVEFDIFFDKGKYTLLDLSEEGKQIVRKIAEGLVAVINDYAETYPGQSVTITIKTVGYADPLGFREKTYLIKDLTEGAEDEVSRYQSAQRKFLNKQLSLFRARAINKAIQQLVVFSETINKDVRLDIQPEIDGKGEEIPPEVQAPYPEADQRRRICKISNIVWSP